MAKRRKQQLGIGTVSHGTMRNEDLFDAFIDELESLNKGKARKYRAEVNRLDDAESEDGMEILSELFDLLGEYCPDFCYFGAIEGDGSDYGCWISWDSIEMAKHDGEIVMSREVADDPAVSAPYYLDVNDHGNATLYARRISRKSVRLVEIWAVV